MDTKQCSGCWYWRGANGDKSQCFKFCHYMVLTGKRRERDGDKCLSRTTQRQKRRRDPFDVPIKQQ